MTAFGWILVVCASYGLIAGGSDNAGRVASLIVLLGVLVWGTGTGL